MVIRPKWPGKPPDQPADIALADAGCARATNPEALPAAHSRKPAERGGSRRPGSLGTLVALSGERRDRRPSHDEQTEHDHDRVTRASGRHSLANGNEPGSSGTPPPEKQRADRPTTRRASRFLERETGVEPATLGLGSQDSESLKPWFSWNFRPISFQVGCRKASQEVAGRCRVASSKNGELGRREVLPPDRQVRFGSSVGRAGCSPPPGFKAPFESSRRAARFGDG